MNDKQILDALDDEIARLQQARAAIASVFAFKWESAKRSVPNPAAKERRISAAGRKRIAEAQRKRWAAQKAAGEIAKKLMKQLSKSGKNR